jgi:hypothetical protein
MIDTDCTTIRSPPPVKQEVEVIPRVKSYNQKEPLSITTMLVSGTIECFEWERICVLLFFTLTFLSIITVGNQIISEIGWDLTNLLNPPIICT